MQGDPSRIAAAVVSGVCCMCLAIIYRQGNTLRGLTAAIGLWCSSAIGMAFGSGKYFIGVFATLFVFVVQAVMHKLYIDNDSMAPRDVTIRMKDDKALMREVVEAVEAMGAECSGRSIVTHSDGTVSVNFVLRSKKRIRFEALAELRDGHPGEIYDVTAA